MSTNPPIYCFNGNPSEEKGECIYKECPMYSETIDTCRIELLKGATAPVAQPQTTQQTQTTMPTAEGEYRLINTLKTGDTSSKDSKINIKGTLSFDPIQRDVDTRQGPRTVTNITIGDETGELKIAFWGDVGNAIMDFQKGDKLFIENIYKIKEPYDNILQADGGKYFKVAKLN